MGGQHLGDFRGIDGAAAFVEESFESSGRMEIGQAAGSGASVLEAVWSAARNKDKSAGGSGMFPAIDGEKVIAFEDVKDLVHRDVAVERENASRRSANFADAEMAFGLAGIE
ncbi:MAG TPA: hypothetical protein VMD30_11500, partial [Tepidisphaeraceae bacterium]|nr:hypothetical protein [Tepidisphaeraceae bacterium]